MSFRALARSSAGPPGARLPALAFLCLAAAWPVAVSGAKAAATPAVAGDVSRSIWSSVTSRGAS